MNSFSEARLSEIHPYVAQKVRELAERLSLEGIEIEVVQGLRTYAYQAKLFAQGRTTPGNIVTKCRPGWSYHNFGLAVDVAPDDPSKPGYQPDWNDTHPTWKRIAEVAVSMGFVAGADFRTFTDKPHLQMTGAYPVNPNDAVRNLFDQPGLEEVWKQSGLPSESMNGPRPVEGMDV
jgi:peptidoglycan L-alanyl-D-glutamate endopeptidase CwlK